LSHIQKIRSSGRVRDPSSADLAKKLGFVGTRLGYILHITDVQHRHIIRDMLSDIGLTPTRASALSFIKANANCGQAELGRALEINRASNMELVNSLVALNAVERRGGRDKRSNALYLTDKGEELCAQVPEAEDTNTGVKEIIVTAQRRTENIQNVSIAATAVLCCADNQFEIYTNSSTSSFPRRSVRLGMPRMSKHRSGNDANCL
jgi:DNA-binding MarR family transcriptional regulator